MSLSPWISDGGETGATDSRRREAAVFCELIPGTSQSQCVRHMRLGQRTTFQQDISNIKPEWFKTRSRSCGFLPLGLIPI
ncbi:Phenylalanine--tRNA ligase beta subunit, chloroplastic [Clarias magur]|uniref:Phenylalanine--tRNA ligase beta subunit, chloroplastic n=1 Tax=Clarias magur TaxID=1594786 RepID=A0A8J4TQJ1_CLAMG|nr:Phenylalanine--tRNA ligase beta subunit, chloroplastic [Clarias magur]